MKRPRIKKVASRVPENVTGNGLAFALDQHHQIEKHDVAEPQKAFSESEETNEEIEKYRTMAGLLYRAHQLLENDRQMLAWNPLKCL